MNKNISFNNCPLGLYTKDRIDQDWNNPSRIMGVGSGRCNIVEDPINKSRHVLEIKYPKGKTGQEEDGGGAQWRLKFGESFLRRIVEYQVMFPIGFDFVKGGKLPGLFRAKGATFGIDNFNFTTFFGGNMPDWASTKDETAYFTDFKFEFYSK
ncbi:MAG: polysaccharide lyase [bacterium]